MSTIPLVHNNAPGQYQTEHSLTDRLEMHRRMTEIRVFEERVSTLYRNGEVPGFVHLSIGQEATAVGACWHLSDDDVITSTHRGHGHCLAKGLDTEGMFAELFGRETGTCRGRGGSMHIADPRKGIFGANGIVAGGIPIAVGAGVAAQLRQAGNVVVAFFGDGAVAQGAFHESVNLASIWNLPVIFFCENNRYAEFSAAEDQHPVELVDRAHGYGVEHVHIDGNDVQLVSDTMADVLGRVRTGQGPVIVEAETYRWHGHYEGDPQRYRDKEELEKWKTADPLIVSRSAIVAHGGTDAQVDEIEAQVRASIEAALESARTAPEPDPSTLLEDVTAPTTAVVTSEFTPAPDSPADWKYFAAVGDALTHALEDDPDVFIAGIDVGMGGNVFGITRGLWERWPERVRDTPISETAVMGTAVGASMAGMKPVVELMYLDFLGVCFDQLMNQAAKLRYMTGGNATLPLTVRTQFGGGRSSGSQHSQSLEALLAHIPGLTVVMPSTAADAYGLLRSAIDSPNPVIVIENRILYGSKGQRVDRGHRVPLGKAAIRRPGRDVTIVSISRMVNEARTAADQLAASGIDAEVIDLRTIAPIDFDTIAQSVQKTNRLVIAHEAVQQFGFGAELAAFAANDLFWHLDGPVVRVGGPHSPVPYAPTLESEWMPGAADIVAAAQQAVQPVAFR